MTDSIDLDEIETETEEPQPNRGDWFWRDEGDPDEEAVAVESDSPASRPVSESGPQPTAEDTTTPHVPQETRDKPVGLPEEQGGAGGASAHEAGAEEQRASAPEPSGPHGGGADAMTLAFSYEAVKRLADPGVVVAGATFADWVGIVGEVDAHVINSFQRSHGVDADFFNGTGTGPAERLAEITEMSMFYAERMVVLGCAGEEWIAERAGWEFLDIETAAKKAGWELD